MHWYAISCAGQEAGIKAAIHSMNMMNEDESTDGILLVDASNAFSSLIDNYFCII